MSNVTIRLAGRRVHLVGHPRDCDLCENHAAHLRLEARPFLRAEISAAVHGDASALADFRGLVSASGLLYDVHRIIEPEVLKHVSWLLQTGRLIAVDCRLPVEANPMAARPASPPKSSASRPRFAPMVFDTPIKTWVSIELLDDTGMPVANEKYLVTVPEGVIKSGTLDSKGRARITQIDPGVCKISFPDLDRREWKKVG
jgi:hypothetical protein